MFCPQCKAEYQQGYATCSGCHVSLVENLPEEKKLEPIPDAKFTNVFETKNAGDVVEIKAVFEAEGITFYFQNENMRIFNSFAQPATLLVLEDDVERALALLKEMNLNSIRLDNQT